MSNTQALAGTVVVPGASIAAATPTPKASATTGAFHVANGQIVDPNGNVFIARGIIPRSCENPKIRIG